MESKMWQLTKEDEDTILKWLRTMVEEFGPEAVTINVPKAWSTYGHGDHIGACRLVYTTDSSVVIDVIWHNVFLRKAVPVLHSLV
jgi:hypothetical protein